METIIGLLFILLPVIFNLIGKRLEKSGKQDTAARMREIAKTLGGDDEDQDVVGWLTEEKDDETDERQSPVVPEPAKVVVEPKPVRVAPAMENVKRTTVKPKKVLLEETKPEKREKIDPKKLVIYSEIMKPKYTE
ncbi:MAG: hypothetical protein E7124_08820 [Bacteroidales bacterium]|nr:hypothetical protein [Bacteroidales bacterium]